MMKILSEDSIEFSAYDKAIVSKEYHEYCEKIKEGNKNILDLEEQTIVSYPYYYWKIEGCAHHDACEIIVRKVKEARNSICDMFYGGWNKSVLTNPENFGVKLNKQHMSFYYMLDYLSSNR